MSHWHYPLHASFELPQNCSHNSCENASTKLNLRVECHERHKMIIVISPLSFYHLLLSAGVVCKCLGDAHPKLRIFSMDALRPNVSELMEEVALKIWANITDRRRTDLSSSRRLRPLSYPRSVTDGVSVCEASPAASSKQRPVCQFVRRLGN